ncbi:MAG: MBL fold metallo-hydrolase [Bacteroidetes bacterium]|nr:MBL fold metallo-hydrolase [Bacteroidota bacterium]
MQLIDTHSSTWCLDLQFRGRPHLIACAVLETSQGLTLIDPGPTTTLKTLETALGPRGGLSAVTNVVLTHIHLDHAGCVGQLAKLVDDIKFYVHPIGAPHLIDPERLIQSAQRIYGDQMDELWGAILPIPEEQVYVVEDDSILDLDGRYLRSCYTPGHASHHIAWLDDQEKIAFVGDAAGMRVQGSDYIIPVAPPPDINVDVWEQSLQRLETHHMDQFFLTHFGVIQHPNHHIQAMRLRLQSWANAVLKSLNDHSESDITRSEAFHNSEMKHMRSMVDSALQEPYNYMGQPRESWAGLARYWRKMRASEITT